MKTFEEINEALREVSKEAYESGFTMVASVTTAANKEETSVHFCGINLVCISQAEIIKTKLLKHIGLL